jgi:hypothetical protein
MMINDYDEAVNGKLVLSVEDEAGKELAKTETLFSIAAFGQGSYSLELTIPDAPGECLLKATAHPEANIKPTVSRRKVNIE